MRHLFYFFFRFLLFYFYCYSINVPLKLINSILRFNFTTWSKEIIRILNFDSIGKVTRLNLLGLEKIKFEERIFLDDADAITDFRISQQADEDKGTKRQISKLILTGLVFKWFATMQPNCPYIRCIGKLVSNIESLSSNCFTILEAEIYSRISLS